MKRNRLYLFPVCVFIAALIMRAVIWIFVIQYLKHHAYRSQAIKSVMNFWSILWPLIFVAEIIIYITIREKIYSRTWVLIHAWCSLMGFIVVPVVYGYAPLFFGRYFFNGIDRLLVGRRVVFWLWVVVGHFFFILTIVKSFNKKQIAIINETPGVLDEFVS